MSRTNIARFWTLAAALTACSNSTSGPAPVQPTQMGQPATSAPAPVTTTAPTQPVMQQVPTTMPAAMAPMPQTPSSTTPPAMTPAVMPAPGGMAAAAGGAATTPSAMMPTMPATNTPSTPSTAAKQYTYEEVIALKRDDLIKAWSEAPAEEVWVGCSGKYSELKHAADGTPMDRDPSMPGMTWGGKCIPKDTKVLYNIVNGKATTPGGSMTATGPAELKPSFMDNKVAVIVVYPGGYELHFRHMGDRLWVGRQAQGGKASGTWYPLGDISGDGIPK